MTVTAALILFFVLILLIYWQTGSLLSQPFSKRRFVLYLLFIAVILLLIWLGIMVFEIGPSMRNM